MTERRGAVEALLLKPEEAARVLNVSRTSLYEMLARGELPSLTIGRSRRVPAEALRRWVAERAREQAGESPAAQVGRAA
jgi:excisionase family DNA binding protein